VRIEAIFVRRSHQIRIAAGTVLPSEVLCNRKSKLRSYCVISTLEVVVIWGVGRGEARSAFHLPHPTIVSGQIGLECKRFVSVSLMQLKVNGLPSLRRWRLRQPSDATEVCPQRAGAPGTSPRCRRRRCFGGRFCTLLSGSVDQSLIRQYCYQNTE
jgi:hypothetical protein